MKYINHHTDIIFLTQRTQRAQRFLSCYAGAGEVAASREESAEVSRKLVLIHPLPLRVLTPVSGGEFAGAVFAVVTNCPPETGGRARSAEGVDEFSFSSSFSSSSSFPF